MSKKLLLLLLFVPIIIFAKVYENLELSQALKLANRENLELSIASLDIQIKTLEAEILQGQNYGKLDLVQNFTRSNDAGNVFGFKLSNREASFRDFGFSEFSLTQNVLHVKPKDLNYPKPRNYFQTKLQYTLPLYTGGKLSNYQKIKESLVKLSHLQREKQSKKVVREVQKSYGDISLLDDFIKNLNLIKINIEKLETMSKSMVKEGYAKRVDVLEVGSKKANITRVINQTKANKTLLLQYLSFLLNADVLSVNTSSYSPPKEFQVNKESMRENIDIQKADEGYRLSTYQLNVAKSAFLPQAGFLGEYSSSDDTFLGDFKEHDAYSVGVQIRWNIFNGGNDTKEYERAKLQNIKAKQQLELAKNGIWLKISKLKTQIQKINFDIQSVKSELELARVIYKNYLGRYQEKLVSINDVIIKQTSEIELILKLQELQNKKYDKIFELEELL